MEHVVGEKQVEEASVLTAVGFWQSDKGQCRILRDAITFQLSYEELIGDGSSRLFGRLEETGVDSEKYSCWKASLMILDRDQEPWYGVSYGEQPDIVGHIHLRLLCEDKLQMETRIRHGEDEEWQSNTAFDPVLEDSDVADQLDDFLKRLRELRATY